MSISSSTRVWTHSRLRGNGRLLLLAIADRADDDGFAWPGVEDLAQRVGVCRRHIPRLIKQASALGEIYVRLGGGRKQSSQYLIAAGLGHGDIAERLTRHFTMASQEADRIAADLIERQKGDIRVMLSPKRMTPESVFPKNTVTPESSFPEPDTMTPESVFPKNTVTPESPFEAQTVTPESPEPSLDPESSNDPDLLEESCPPPDTRSPGRLTITGERLRTAYLPRPESEAPPSSADPPGEGQPIPPGLVGLYHTHLLHYARPGDYRTLCGQPVSRFETAASGGVTHLDVCKTCARVSGDAPAQPHIAIINAWWDGIPEAIRPPGAAPIEPNLRDARDLRDAGITPDQVREYVKAQSPGYVKWARWKSNEEKKPISPVLPLSNVKKNIKAYFVREDHEPEKPDETRTGWDTVPPRPRVSGIKQLQ